MRFFLVLLLLAACKKPLAGGVVDVAVTEKGFEPDRVNVAPGAMVTLRFTRRIRETCADAVDVEGDPVRHMLPVGVPVEIKLKAPPSGALAFACPMKMVNGAIVVVGH